MESFSRERTKRNKLSKEIAITAMFVAITFLFTYCVNVKIPFIVSNGGLIHLGNIIQVAIAGIIVLLIINPLEKGVKNL